jgi:hypothetical protein
MPILCLSVYMYLALYALGAGRHLAMFKVHDSSLLPSGFLKYKDIQPSPLYRTRQVDLRAGFV